MYDAAVTPGNLSAPVEQNQNQGTTGEFGTNSQTVANSPIPGVTPIQYPNQFLNNASLGKSIGSNIQQSSGGGGGGSPIGGILGAVGSIFGGIFAEGGLVGDGANGYAAGGQVDPRMEKAKKAAAGTEGYLLGAYHQQKYGGTPETLQKAAMEIKQMLTDKLQGGQQPQQPSMQPQGLADGGTPSSDNLNVDQELLQQALTQSLGLGGGTTTPSASAATVQAQSTAPTETPQNQTVNQQPMQSQQPMQQQQADPNAQQGYLNAVSGASNPEQDNGGFKTGGYMERFAVGGPPITQGAPMQAPPGLPDPGDPNANTPPLKPGQEFQGDGSVKGPGGPTDDSIPARLSNGEFVMSVPAVQFFGVDKLTKMNEQGKQGFMQAIGQVEQNQTSPQTAPQSMQGIPPQGTPQMPPSQPPVGQAKGGMMAKRNNAYMGL